MPILKYNKYNLCEEGIEATWNLQTKLTKLLVVSVVYNAEPAGRYVTSKDIIAGNGRILKTLYSSIDMFIVQNPFMSKKLYAQFSFQFGKRLIVDENVNDETRRV